MRIAQCPGHNGNGAACLLLKSVHDGVVDEVVENLAQWPREAVHLQGVGNIHLHVAARRANGGVEREQNFRHQIREQKPASLGAGLVHCHLFETGHQGAGSGQVARQDIGGHASIFQES